MKGNRLRALLGYALLGGTALLFAGCGQQAGGGQGQEPPKPINISLSGVSNGQVVSGVVTVGVSVNEDSQPREVKLYVDDKLVGQYTIAPQGIRPQALSYEFKVNTAACDLAYLGREDSTGCTPSDPTPLFTNGSHTVRAEVTNPVETKSLSVTVILDNSDTVLLTMSGNNAQDATGYTWYGGQDLTLRAVPVIYSGKTATAVRFTQNNWTGSIPGTTISLTTTSVAEIGTGVEVPLSSGQATLTIARSSNTSLEGGKQIIAGIRYSDGTLDSYAGTAYFALDFKAPGSPVYRVNLNGVKSDTLDNVIDPATGTDGWLNGNSPISVSATENGVGGVTYQGIEVRKASDNSLVATLNPGDTLASVPEASSATGAYYLKVLNLRDALGNTLASPGASSPFNLDKTKPTLSTTFGANGRVLNGTLGLSSRIPLTARDPGTVASGVVGGAPNGAAPSASSFGTSGWWVEVTTGGCTYKLNAPNTFFAVNLGPVTYDLDMPSTAASTPPSCTTAYPTITPTGGDGDYTVTVRLVDKARNVSDPLTVNFYWLTQKPIVQFNGLGNNIHGAVPLQANPTVTVSHPKPLLKAILYAYRAGAGANEVQVVAPAPVVDITNAAAPAPFNPDGTVVIASYKDFTTSASNFNFTLQFNMFGSWDVYAAAVPVAYDNAGNIDVTNLSSATSVNVTTAP